MGVDGGITEGALISAALSAAGSGASLIAQNNQAKQQDQAAARNIMAQGQLNQQAGAAVSKLTNNIAKSNPQATAAKLNAQYAAALDQNKNQTDGSVNLLPGGSTAYKTASGNAVNNINNYGTSQAGILAQTDAPQLQRLGENEAIGSTAGQLGLLQGQSNDATGLMKAQVGSIGQNPWMDALGATLQGAGKVYGANSAYNSNKGSGSSDQIGGA